jgi:hypothetical protein
MSKTQSSDPNVVTEETIAANGQAVDIKSIKKNDGTVVFAIDKDGDISILKMAATLGAGLSASYVVFKVGSIYYAKNGSTGAIDYSGASFLAVIQSAHDAAPTAGARIVLLPGDYSLGDAETFIITKKVDLVGYGAGDWPGTHKTRILKTGSGWAIDINIPLAAYHLTFENFGIEGDANADGGISCLGVTHSTFRDISIFNFSKAGAIGLKLDASMIDKFFGVHCYGNDIGLYTVNQSNSDSFYNCEFSTSGSTGVYLSSAKSLFTGCAIQSNPLGVDLATLSDGAIFMGCWFEANTVIFRKSAPSISNMWISNLYSGGTFSDDANFFNSGYLYGYNDIVLEPSLDSFIYPSGNTGKIAYNMRGFSYAHEVFIPFCYGTCLHTATREVDTDTFTGKNVTLKAQNDYVSIDFTLKTPGNYTALIRVHDDSAEAGGIEFQVRNYGGDGVVATVNKACAAAYGYLTVPFTVTNAAYSGRTEILIRKRVASANDIHLDYGGVVPAFYPGNLEITGVLTPTGGIANTTNLLSADFAIDSAAVVTVTTAHGLSVTPSKEDCTVVVIESSNVDDWACGYAKIESVDATNVVCKVNVTVASGTAGAKAKLGIKIDVR